MLCRYEANSYIGVLFRVDDLIPPIHVDRVLYSAFHHVVAVSESCIDAGIVSSIVECAERFDIHVVVMVV